MLRARNRAAERFGSRPDSGARPHEQRIRARRESGGAPLDPGRSEEPRLFTSESVTEGHPDKVADQISDAILDLHLKRDPGARVACETLVTAGTVLVAGETASSAPPDDDELRAVIRNAIRRIGYVGRDDSFDADSVEISIRLGRQASDIAMGVDTGGAGDQGMMFGFACDETPELMPLAITLAHRLTRRLAEVRRSGLVPSLGPDGKSQVTVACDGDGRPRSVPVVVVSSQHAPGTGRQVVLDIEEHVVRCVVEPGLRGTPFRILVNPTGAFEQGGPAADCGLTGRKIIVDTYGGMARHGGGAFSGKDPTKVDRSAAYMARHVAKNVVAAGLARRAEVQLAYAIGRADPVSVRVDTFGTGVRADANLEAAVRRVFGLTPREIIEALDLRRPIYETTASGGHFGRSGPEFTWERTHRAADLAAELA